MKLQIGDKMPKNVEISNCGIFSCLLRAVLPVLVNDVNAKK